MPFRLLQRLASIVPAVRVFLLAVRVLPIVPDFWQCSLIRHRNQSFCCLLRFPSTVCPISRPLLSYLHVLSHSVYLQPVVLHLANLGPEALPLHEPSDVLVKGELGAVDGKAGRGR